MKYIWKSSLLMVVCFVEIYNYKKKKNVNDRIMGSIIFNLGWRGLDIFMGCNKEKLV